jgi:hypothetical protein
MASLGARRAINPPMRSRVAALLALWLVALGAVSAAARAAENVLYVGDSLGVGTAPQLERVLAGSANVSSDNRIGRPSPEGVSVLQQLFSAGDDVIVFDLGTNDDMSQPGRLAADLQAARQIAGDRCLVVATLNRPDFAGVSIDGLNRVIHRFARQVPGVLLVDWNAYVRGRPGLLGGDGVHATPEGYAIRAQLFAEAIAACGAPASLSAPRTTRRIVEPAPRGARPRRTAKPVEVPGIEASGISFTEPLAFRAGGARVTGELLLPNTKPPYPAVVVTSRSARAQADYLAAHGIAALVYHSRASEPHAQAAEVIAAVDAVGARDDIQRDRIALLGTAPVAALAAGDSRQVAAVVVLSPGLGPKTDRAWAIRRALGGSGTEPVATWFALRAGAGDDAAAPASAWRHVRQPVLAVWQARDSPVPARPASAAIARALSRSGNRDRTFVAAKNTHAARALIARWLGAHLTAAPVPVVATKLVLPADGPAPADVTQASVLVSPPVQLAWLLVPVALLAFALVRGLAPLRLSLPAAAIALASLGAIAGGIAVALADDGHDVAEVAGIPLLFALARLLAIAAAGAALALARRRAWLPAASVALWTALALFWLL